MSITAHVIVKNEEQWIWYAINSVIEYVDKIIIFDTGSTDQTINIIKSIRSPKIKFEEKGLVNPKQLVDLRNEQINKTETDWFMLLDGDEVWPENSIRKITTLNFGNKKAVVVRTRNCVGDIYHYLPENRGHYRLLGMEGHFNIRFYKKSPGYKWVGTYPLEAYSNDDGPINNQDDKLLFIDTYYWHLTHLVRSSVENKKRRIEKGIRTDEKDIPQVFFKKSPGIVPNPFIKPSFYERIIASFITPLKEIKAKI